MIIPETGASPIEFAIMYTIIATTGSQPMRVP
jgi:hypothetical protein